MNSPFREYSTNKAVINRRRSKCKEVAMRAKKDFMVIAGEKKCDFTVSFFM